MALPNIPDILALLKRGKVNEVVPMLERLVRLMPASVSLHVLLARAHDARGDSEAALASWRQAAFLMPNSPVVREGLQQALQTATAAPALTVTEWVPDAETDDGADDEWDEEEEDSGWRGAAPTPPPAWKKVDVVSAGGTSPKPTPPAARKPAAEDDDDLPGISLGMPTPLPPKREAPPAESHPSIPVGPEAPALDLSDPDLPELDVPSYEAPDPDAEDAPAWDDDEWGEAEWDDEDAADDLAEDLTLHDETTLVDDAPAVGDEETDTLSELPSAADLPDLDEPEAGLPEFDAPAMDLPDTDQPDWDVPDLDEDVALPPPAPATPLPAATPPASRPSSKTPLARPPQPLGPQEELPFNDLDRLIEDLEAARIVPGPNVDEIEAPSLDDETDDMVSETLARIYAAQQQYDEAARIYELLAAQQPARAAEYRQKAVEMRSRASDV